MLESSLTNNAQIKLSILGAPFLTAETHTMVGSRRTVFEHLVEVLEVLHNNVSVLFQDR